jgi:RNA polymerase sigma-70 factor (ECF subfamily)
VLETYGPEVHGYIRGVSRAGLADDIYGQVVLDLWADIERFKWRCEARTYLFALARNAIARVHKLSTRATRRERAYADAQWLDALIPRSRTATPAYLRSEVKMRLRALRERLGPEEQTLLVLRVDRRMSFSELALVMSPPHEELSAGEQARIATRLRKRFEAVKKKLHRMMVEDGLLDRS